MYKTPTRECIEVLAAVARGSTTDEWKASYGRREIMADVRHYRPALIAVADDRTLHLTAVGAGLLKTRSCPKCDCNCSDPDWLSCHECGEPLVPNIDAECSKNVHRAITHFLWKYHDAPIDKISFADRAEHLLHTLFASRALAKGLGPIEGKHGGHIWPRHEGE